MNKLGTMLAFLTVLGCAHSAEIDKPKAEQKVVLRVGEFFDAQWTNYGFYDDSGMFEHQYGGPDAGYFAYHFGLDDADIHRLVVRARLSAESSDRGKPMETSDVSLLINGVEIGTQRVQPDDQKGKVYEWVVDKPDFIKKLGLSDKQRNELRFEVKEDAKSKHGLCLYGESLQEIGQGQPIEIHAEARHM